MHDLIRDMAIKTARVSHRFWVQSGMQLEDIPNDEEWSEDLVRVSLMSNHFQSIPSSSSPKCPKLLTLLLCNNYFLRVIPRLFFMHMKSLTVLALSYTSIESLPSSISKLESLTALLLRSCKELRFVPSLENLTALRRLDLHGSSEQVTLRGKEIGSLEKLETFYGRFEDISEFNSCIRSWEEWEPEEFRIVVGNGHYDVDWIDDMSYHGSVILTNAVGSEDTVVLPRGTTCLELLECQGIPSLSMHPMAFSFLKFLHIRGCHGLKRVFTPTVLSNLQSLESCYVSDCRQLVEIIGETSDEDENKESTTAVMTMAPRLINLSSIDLPELKSFYNFSIKVSDSLECIKIGGCPRLMRITLLWEEPHPDHPGIFVEEDWWDKVEWKHTETKDVLQPYVEFCTAEYMRTIF